jgi:hypothetical protein
MMMNQPVKYGHYIEMVHEKRKCFLHVFGFIQVCKLLEGSVYGGYYAREYSTTFEEWMNELCYDSKTQ